MSEERTFVDVADLPTEGFGAATLVWWGTLGFMVIEGFTLLLMAASYLYLRQNEYDWPPAPTPNPDLLVPTISTLFLLAIILPMSLVDRAARRKDRAGVTRWLVVATLMTVPAVALRWYDLMALNVRWDAHAYGSAVWGIVILHGTLLLVDLFETGALAVLFVSGHAQVKHFADAADAALYQYFLSLSWVPLYLIVYWGPRVL